MEGFERGEVRGERCAFGGEDGRGGVDGAEEGDTAAILVYGGRYECKTRLIIGALDNLG